VKYFWRYLCAFCACRFLWAIFRGHSTARAVQHVEEKACPHHLAGCWLFLAGVVAGPFVLGIAAGLVGILFQR
jgi:hypothetical protein